MDSKIKETLTDLEETGETFKTQEVTESPTGEMEPHNKHPGPMVEASMGDKQASRQSGSHRKVEIYKGLGEEAKPMMKDCPLKCSHAIPFGNAG